MLSNKDKVLLFDFICFLNGKLGRKIDFLETINEYEESRYGKENAERKREAD